MDLIIIVLIIGKWGVNASDRLDVNEVHNLTF